MTKRVEFAKLASTHFSMLGFKMIYGQSSGCKWNVTFFAQIVFFIEMTNYLFGQIFVLPPIVTFVTGQFLAQGNGPQGNRILSFYRLGLDYPPTLKVSHFDDFNLFSIHMQLISSLIVHILSHEGRA